MCRFGVHHLVSNVLLLDLFMFDNIQTGIPDDPVEIRLERRLDLDLLSLVPHVDEGGLHYFLGLITVVEERVGVLAKRSVISLEYHFKSTFGALFQRL
jgi:hypothetical protein